MSPVWPMTIAATIGPTPYMSVSDVPDAATAATIRGFDAVSSSSGGLDSPLPFIVELVGPDTEPIGLAGRGTGLDLVEYPFVAVDSDSGVAGLVGIDSDHHGHGSAFLG
jgi:hypothetical protein